MKKSRMLILCLLSLVGIVSISVSMTSCISDSMTTSSSDILTFSRDTVDFDTVFTDLGTPTARLIVRNRAKKGINITSIRLRNPESNFSFNVDGVSGKEFHDVEIRGRDSIFVFIECRIPETAGSQPVLVSDQLEFVTNGVTQTVELEAYGQNVTRLRNVRLAADTHFTADRPYVVFDSLTVEPGATLFLEPGTQLLFHDGARLVVEGRLHAVGEPGKMIDMRGDRLDNVLPNVSYDIMSGQWHGIRIAADSYDNVMEYVDMRSTVAGLVIDSCTNLAVDKLTLTNSWLHNSKGNVLTSNYARVNAYGCCFSEAANAVVQLTGGRHEFLQCTFANNYLFSAIRSAIVSLYHLFPDDTETANSQPLMQANFANSIIYGLGDDLNEGNLTGANVFFDYVSLKAAGSDDENFRNCLWDTDPLFLTVRADYYFNYRLQADSPVKAAGDPALVTSRVLYDMDGIDRLANGNPSLGAYQYFDF